MATLQLSVLPGLACRGQRGCALVQLTSDKAWPQAHLTYGRLHFGASHKDLRLRLW